MPGVLARNGSRVWCDCDPAAFALRLARDAGHIAARSGVRCIIDLDRVPFADGAVEDDLRFGEDFELLAATPDPLDFTVIGRCEEGSGVEGVPAGGWEHFL